MTAPLSEKYEAAGFPVGWFQMIGEQLCFIPGDLDPRAVHDNGKPVYRAYAIDPSSIKDIKCP